MGFWQQLQGGGGGGALQLVSYAAVGEKALAAGAFPSLSGEKMAGVVAGF